MILSQKLNFRVRIKFLKRKYNESLIKPKHLSRKSHWISGYFYSIVLTFCPRDIYFIYFIFFFSKNVFHNEDIAKLIRVIVKFNWQNKEIIFHRSIFEKHKNSFLFLFFRIVALYNRKSYSIEKEKYTTKQNRLQRN